MRPLAALLLAACQPRAEGVAPVCDVDPPAPGELRVGLLACAGQVPVGGEGRAGADWLLANRLIRVVIRHPQDAATLPGLGGGTLLDAAPWGLADRLHEVVPLVGGGWLDGVTREPHPDGVTLRGTVRSLPGRTARDEGRPGRIRWRLRPDDPWLVAEGAEGFWVHPQGDVEVLPGGVVLAAPWVLGPAGGIVQDTGGALWIDGTDRLLVSDDRRAWEALATGPTTRLRGAAEAGRIALRRDGRTVGRTPVVDGAFDLRVPADLDAVRLEVSGRAPGPEVPPGEDLALVAGGAGALAVTPVWDDGIDRPLTVRWTSADGRAGTSWIPAAGATLGLGAGRFALTLSAGPQHAPRQVDLTLADGETAPLEVALDRVFPTPERVIATFGRPADRSRDWRGSDRIAAWATAGEGAAWASFTPLDDVAGVSTAIPDLPPLRFRNGVRVAGPGFAIGAWPWAASAREALHGGPAWLPEDPLDAAALMRGGPDDARTLWVDLGWLAGAGTPGLADPRPDLVALAHPGPGGDGWADWLRWLDAGLVVVPTGPTTWVRVDDPRRVGAADVEQALSRGRVSAGTGPLARLTVDGVAEGDRLPGGDTGHTGAPGVPERRVEVRIGGGGGLDHLVLRSSGGEVLRLPTPPSDAEAVVRVDRALTGTWVLVQGWADDPAGDWVVSAPVWLSDPADR